MVKNDKDAMFNDVVLQIVLALVMALSFLFMNDIPKKLFSKLRLRNRTKIKAKHHFVQGAQLLARARSSTSRSHANSLAKQALTEAENAIALDPKDAAAYLLKSLALDIQGFRASALDSMDVALSPLAAKSLSDSERGDAFLKRAELKMRLGKGTSQRGGVDSVKGDLEEAVRLNPKNSRTFCVLGEWYEGKNMKEEAVKAYEEAIQLEPELRVANDALNRIHMK
ncbi:hypothetical protein Lal_00048353 [Lupinus albus]|uniref:Putative 43kDa postsynaptic protein n=1 Tax=Lupinus albus TaxID=3870 RepID=A0A6A4QMN3_LUPAL|nr:putative 43kDa postsynaptic protein [Lupinus albus]KAF1869073.1 hypothetical protein Lal_00048353 [Lupinus albus]